MTRNRPGARNLPGKRSRSGRETGPGRKGPPGPVAAARFQPVASAFLRSSTWALRWNPLIVKGSLASSLLGGNTIAVAAAPTRQATPRMPNASGKLSMSPSRMSCSIAAGGRAQNGF